MSDFLIMLYLQRILFLLITIVLLIIISILVCLKIVCSLDFYYHFCRISV